MAFLIKFWPKVNQSNSIKKVKVCKKKSIKIVAVFVGQDRITYAGGVVVFSVCEYTSTSRALCSSVGQRWPGANPTTLERQRCSRLERFYIREKYFLF
jgi:hypothetical protein